MSLYLTSRMASLPPYVPGAHSDSVNALRLNTNESPYPPSEGVARARAAYSLTAAESSFPIRRRYLS